MSFNNLISHLATERPRLTRTQESQLFMLFRMNLIQANLGKWLTQEVSYALTQQLESDDPLLQYQFSQLIQAYNLQASQQRQLGIQSIFGREGVGITDSKITDLFSIADNLLAQVDQQWHITAQLRQKLADYKRLLTEFKHVVADEPSLQSPTPKATQADLSLSATDYTQQDKQQYSDQYLEQSSQQNPHPNLHTTPAGTQEGLSVAKPASSLGLLTLVLSLWQEGNELLDLLTAQLCQQLGLQAQAGADLTAMLREAGAYALLSALGVGHRWSQLTNLTSPTKERQAHGITLESFYDVVAALDGKPSARQKTRLQAALACQSFASESQPNSNHPAFTQQADLKHSVEQDNQRRKNQANVGLDNHLDNHLDNQLDDAHQVDQNLSDQDGIHANKLASARAQAVSSDFVGSNLASQNLASQNSAYYDFQENRKTQRSADDFEPTSQLGDVEFSPLVHGWAMPSSRTSTKTLKVVLPTTTASYSRKSALAEEKTAATKTTTKAAAKAAVKAAVAEAVEAVEKSQTATELAKLARTTPTTTTGADATAPTLVADFTVPEINLQNHASTDLVANQAYFDFEQELRQQELAQAQELANQSKVSASDFLFGAAGAVPNHAMLDAAEDTASDADNADSVTLSTQQQLANSELTKLELTKSELTEPKLTEPKLTKPELATQSETTLEVAPQPQLQARQASKQVEPEIVALGDYDYANDHYSQTILAHGKVPTKVKLGSSGIYKAANLLYDAFGKESEQTHIVIARTPAAHKRQANLGRRLGMYEDAAIYNQVIAQSQQAKKAKELERSRWLQDYKTLKQQALEQEQELLFKTLSSSQPGQATPVSALAQSLLALEQSAKGKIALAQPGASLTAPPLAVTQAAAKVLKSAAAAPDKNPDKVLEKNQQLPEASIPAATEPTNSLAHGAVDQLVAKVLVEDYDAPVPIKLAQDRDLSLTSSGWGNSSWENSGWANSDWDASAWSASGANGSEHTSNSAALFADWSESHSTHWSPVQPAAGLRAQQAATGQPSAPNPANSDESAWGQSLTSDGWSAQTWPIEPVVKQTHGAEVAVNLNRENKTALDHKPIQAVALGTARVESSKKPGTFGSLKTGRSRFLKRDKKVAGVNFAPAGLPTSLNALARDKDLAAVAENKDLSSVAQGLAVPNGTFADSQTKADKASAGFSHQSGLSSTGRFSASDIDSSFSSHLSDSVVGGASRFEHIHYQQQPSVFDPFAEPVTKPDTAAQPALAQRKQRLEQVFAQTAQVLAHSGNLPLEADLGLPQVTPVVAKAQATFSAPFAQISEPETEPELAAPQALVFKPHSWADVFADTLNPASSLTAEANSKSSQPSTAAPVDSSAEPADLSHHSQIYVKTQGQEIVLARQTNHLDLKVESDTGATFSQASTHKLERIGAQVHPSHSLAQVPNAQAGQARAHAGFTARTSSAATTLDATLTRFNLHTQQQVTNLPMAGLSVNANQVTSFGKTLAHVEQALHDFSHGQIAALGRRLISHAPMRPTRAAWLSGVSLTPEATTSTQTLGEVTASLEEVTANEQDSTDTAKATVAGTGLDSATTLRLKEGYFEQFSPLSADEFERRLNEIKALIPHKLSAERITRAMARIWHIQKATSSLSADAQLAKLTLEELAYKTRQNLATATNPSTKPSTNQSTSQETSWLDGSAGNQTTTWLGDSTDNQTTTWLGDSTDNQTTFAIAGKTQNQAKAIIVAHAANSAGTGQANSTGIEQVNPADAEQANPADAEQAKAAISPLARKAINQLLETSELDELDWYELKALAEHAEGLVAGYGQNKLSSSLVNLTIPNLVAPYSKRKYGANYFANGFYPHLGLIPTLTYGLYPDDRSPLRPFATSALLKNTCISEVSQAYAAQERAGRAQIKAPHPVVLAGFDKPGEVIEPVLDASLFAGSAVLGLDTPKREQARAEARLRQQASPVQAQATSAVAPEAAKPTLTHAPAKQASQKELKQDQATQSQAYSSTADVLSSLAEQATADDFSFSDDEFDFSSLDTVGRNFGAAAKAFTTGDIDDFDFGSLEDLSFARVSGTGFNLSEQGLTWDYQGEKTEHTQDPTMRGNVAASAAHNAESLFWQQFSQANQQLGVTLRQRRLAKEQAKERALARATEQSKVAPDTQLNPQLNNQLTPQASQTSLAPEQAMLEFAARTIQAVERHNSHPNHSRVMQAVGSTQPTQAQPASRVLAQAANTLSITAATASWPGKQETSGLTTTNSNLVADGIVPINLGNRALARSFTGSFLDEKPAGSLRIAIAEGNRWSSEKAAALSKELTRENSAKTPNSAPAPTGASSLADSAKSALTAKTPSAQATLASSAENSVLTQVKSISLAHLVELIQHGDSLERAMLLARQQSRIPQVYRHTQANPSLDLTAVTARDCLGTAAGFVSSASFTRVGKLNTPSKPNQQTTDKLSRSLPDVAQVAADLASLAQDLTAVDKVVTVLAQVERLVAHQAQLEPTQARPEPNLKALIAMLPPEMAFEFGKLVQCLGVVSKLQQQATSWLVDALLKYWWLVAQDEQFSQLLHKTVATLEQTNRKLLSQKQISAQDLQQLGSVPQGSRLVLDADASTSFLPLSTSWVTAGAKVQETLLRALTLAPTQPAHLPSFESPTLQANGWADFSQLEDQAQVRQRHQVHRICQPGAHSVGGVNLGISILADNSQLARQASSKQLRSQLRGLRRQAAQWQQKLHTAQWVHYFYGQTLIAPELRFLYESAADELIFAYQHFLTQTFTQSLEQVPLTLPLLQTSHCLASYKIPLLLTAQTSVFQAREKTLEKTSNFTPVSHIYRLNQGKLERKNQADLKQVEVEQVAVKQAEVEQVAEKQAEGKQIQDKQVATSTYSSLVDLTNLTGIGLYSSYSFAHHIGQLLLTDVLALQQIASASDQAAQQAAQARSQSGGLAIAGYLALAGEAPVNNLLTLLGTYGYRLLVPQAKLASKTLAWHQVEAGQIFNAGPWARELSTKLVARFNQLEGSSRYEDDQAQDLLMPKGTDKHQAESQAYKASGYQASPNLSVDNAADSGTTSAKLPSRFEAVSRQENALEERKRRLREQAAGQRQLDLLTHQDTVAEFNQEIADKLGQELADYAAGLSYGSSSGLPGASAEGSTAQASRAQESNLQASHTVHKHISQLQREHDEQLIASGNAVVDDFVWNAEQAEEVLQKLAEISVLANAKFALEGQVNAADGVVATAELKYVPRLVPDLQAYQAPALGQAQVAPAPQLSKRVLAQLKRATGIQADLKHLSPANRAKALGQAFLQQQGIAEASQAADKLKQLCQQVSTQAEKSAYGLDQDLDLINYISALPTLAQLRTVCVPEHAQKVDHSPSRIRAVPDVNFKFADFERGNEADSLTQARPKTSHSTSHSLQHPVSGQSTQALRALSQAGSADSHHLRMHQVTAGNLPLPGSVVALALAEAATAALTSLVHNPTNSQERKKHIYDSARMRALVLTESELLKGNYDILEPTPLLHPEVSYQEIGVYLVPALALAATGSITNTSEQRYHNLVTIGDYTQVQRLGMGGGFYDRELAQASAYWQNLRKAKLSPGAPKTAHFPQAHQAPANAEAVQAEGFLPYTLGMVYNWQVFNQLPVAPHDQALHDLVIWPADL